MKPQMQADGDGAPPFDIDKFRANIGRDPKAEQMLLSLFLKSCAESLALVKEHFPADPGSEFNQLWKKHMHQMKGAAMNLGADAFAKITAEGQAQFEAPLTVKAKLLAEAEQAFKEIDRYISGLL